MQSLRQVFFALWLFCNIAFCQLPTGVIDTQSANDKPPTPEESLAKITVPDGFTVTLFAGEPDVYQPIAMEFDDRGRLWVVENFSYPDWTSQDRDRILIFEDTDNDGSFDNRKVFAEGLNNLTGIALGFGGVWCCSTPHFIFIPDRDRDDVPDGKPVVKLDGWNDNSKAVQHNVFNGMSWGPDGWMYGAHGILADSLVGKPGSNDEERQRINCGIWRYHPIREEFDVVAHGTTNPWGIDFDEHGEGFFTNCVIGHLWHLIPNARYKRMYGSHFNPHAYALIDACSDHLHWGGGSWTDSRGGIGMHSEAGGGHAHVGALIYQGGRWPTEYRGSLFTANLHGNRLNRDILRRQGSGYVGSHAPDFLMANDPWFRGIAIKSGPDGNVFVSDWTDLGECHDNDGTHRSSGRIYKVSYMGGDTSDWEPPASLDLQQLESRELLKMVDHENNWYWNRARRILHERAASERPMAEVIDVAIKLLGQPENTSSRKLRLLSAISLMGGAGRLDYESLMVSDDEYVQAWAIRDLVGHGDLLASSAKSDSWLRKLVEISSSATAKVQLEIASTLHSVSPTHPLYFEAVSNVMQVMPSGDSNLPAMIWSAAERMAEVNDKFVDLLLTTPKKSELDDLRSFVARRYVSEAPDDSARLGRVVAVATELSQSREQAAVAVMRGLSQAVKSKRALRPPLGWAALAKRMDHRIIVELSLKFGDAATVRKLRARATDPNLDRGARATAIKLLATNKVPGTESLLLNLLGDPKVRREAIIALENFNTVAVAKGLISHYESFDAGESQAAIRTLTSSRGHARRLLAAVASNQIRATDIRPSQAMAIYQMKDSDLRRKLRTFWGDVRSTPREQKQKIADWKALLGPKVMEAANLQTGRRLYAENCGKCHRLFGEGGDIGPDLTGSDRKNLDYILQNVITPSAMVGKDYRMQTIRLNDGRSITGAIRQETSRSLSVQTTEKLISIDRDDVESIDTSQLSLMPEGQFDVLTKNQVRDLIGYLRSSGVVSN